MKETNREIKITRGFTLGVMGLSVLALVTGCRTSHQRYAYYSQPAPVIAAGGSEETSSEYQSSPSQGSSASAVETRGHETVIPLYEETLKTGTREVDGGTVRLRKIVKTETVNEPVQVRRETVTIDRVPASENAQANNLSSQPFQEQDYVIHLKQEEPVVEKQVHEIGKIVARKNIEQQQENVQRQVRKDAIDVVKEGNPQNVIISQDVYQAEPNEAQGAATSPGEQSSGQAVQQQDQSQPEQAAPQQEQEQSQPQDQQQNQQEEQQQNQQQDQQQQNQQQPQ